MSQTPVKQNPTQSAMHSVTVNEPPGNYQSGNLASSAIAGGNSEAQAAYAVRTSPIQNGAKALLLIALGLFLYSRIAGGTLVFYINERFFGYTLFAFIGLLAIGLSFPIIRRKGAEAGPSGTSSDGQMERQAGKIDYQYHDLAPHDHSRDHRITLLGALVVALPILLGTFVPPRPLGASALDMRELNLDLRTGTGNVPAAIAAAGRNDGPKNILDWWHTFQSTSDLTTLEGSEVQVQGFVYHDERYGEGHFMVTRFVVSCCTADASAVALLVAWPEAADLETDQWVEVRGVFAGGDVDEWRPPILQADTISPIDIPSHPYLYP